MWHDLWPWFLATLILGLTLAALWLALRRPRSKQVDDTYERAVELWLAGDLAAASHLLREVVRRDPGRMQPYLQLGILLRLTGDPGRAAAMHRSLSVRDDLPSSRRAVVGLELAEDLLALSKPHEAEAVLQQLDAAAADQERLYRLRFAAALGLRKLDHALDALREGEKKLDKSGAARLRALRAAWLTDRVLRCVRSRQYDAASRYLSHARKLPEAAARVLLLRAMLAASEGDDERTVRAVTEGLAQYPAEMAPALHLLEAALLATGRFAMAVPILEAACSDDASPPELWMALVHLYEKLDRRQEAMVLLQNKSHDHRLTPNAAAFYLRHLAAEEPGAAFSKVWNLLHMPKLGHGFCCRHCGHRTSDLHWFCAKCLSPDSFEPAHGEPLPISGDATAPQLSAPRY